MFPPPPKKKNETKQNKNASIKTVRRKGEQTCQGTNNNNNNYKITNKSITGNDSTRCVPRTMVKFKTARTSSCAFSQWFDFHYVAQRLTSKITYTYSGFSNIFSGWFNHRI